MQNWIMSWNSCVNLEAINGFYFNDRDSKITYVTHGQTVTIGCGSRDAYLKLKERTLSFFNPEVMENNGDVINYNNKVAR